MQLIHIPSPLQIPEVARELQANIKEINAEVGLFFTCRFLGAHCLCP